MTLSHSPRIVTDGLVLCLDAANPKSYPGSGTVWTDLSGNENNGTLVNGVGYSGDNKGSLTFDGVDDYVNISNSSIGNFETSSFTVSCWGKATSGSTGTRGIFSKYNPHSGNGTGWFMFHRAGQIWVRITQDLVAPLEASSIAINITVDKWYFFTMVRTANSFSLYVNDTKLQENTTTNIINCSSSAPLRIGSGYSSGYYYSGNCSNAQIYNRALTAAEIQQNFQATRGRYGI
jgi:hypothetical protein